jgi:TP901-1 family phage major tail protein
MPAQKGKDLLIKIEDEGAFVAVAGLRAREIAFNAESVDLTHSESAGAGASSWPRPECAGPGSPAPACVKTKRRTA